jgi:hypothetical protein
MGGGMMGGAAGGMMAPSGGLVAPGGMMADVAGTTSNARGWNPTGTGMKEQEQDIKQFLTYGERRTLQAVGGVLLILGTVALVIYFMFIHEDPIMRALPEPFVIVAPKQCLIGPLCSCPTLRNDKLSTWGTLC